jgi:uncharacterized protein YjbI with pentapeptide repeats
MVVEKDKQAAGETQGRTPWTLRDFGGKTLWDWLQLLIVPVVLSLITVVFAWQQDIRQDQIESKRANAERELARERAQDEALQAYLNQMSTLLLEKNLRNSGSSEEDTEVRTLARARTLTVLRRLDPSRKTALMQFLVEADLVQRVDGRDPIISLRGADLNNAVLDFTNMPGAVLSQANLSDASLYEADLSDADLSGADLSDASLYDADLSNADLLQADLSNANLRGAVLEGANLSGAYLSSTNLRGAFLSGAYLGGGLTENPRVLTMPANLRGADLRGADLRGADLSDASNLLGDAGIITNEELEQQAASLEGATMPNGQKYEDWLKSRGEDGENSGSS